MKTSTDHYQVVGNPIAHSLSPQIHQQFAAQTQQALHYDKQLVELGGFAAAMDAFIQQGGKGVNITVPFKQDAWQYADQRSKRAERAGALNTLKVNADGSTFGDNTDGLGLVRDLIQNQHIALKGQRILLLGAGGAVRGVLQPLLEQQPALLHIANRTAAKAEALALDFADLGKLHGSGFAELENLEPFDLIINGTAASLSGELPPLPEHSLITKGSAYDMMYSQTPTAFVQWALQHGAAKAVDGLGMLVEQAAEAFLLWRGVRPDSLAVMKTLRPES
ncbi:MAG: shikimate dehydrogenase [Gammaproteobacteria bacterium]|nr:shikimate dehydrogenase [Gammaproteobacteria bacterium]